CWQPAGSACPRVPVSISCSIRAPSVSSVVTARCPPCRSRTGLSSARARRMSTERSMRQPSGGSLITCDRYDAVLFDLDGVITNTASIHAACWKQMFDEYLQERGRQTNETFRSFDPVDDYRLHVDGKPRFDGVRDFLKSRGIHLPDGTPHDPPPAETVDGLGNRKNHLVTKAIEEKGVEAYEGSVRFIRELRRHGCKVAVVSSSENCEAVLKAAKVDDLFEVRVDGAMVEAQHLAGKPAPDTFLIAA